MRGRGSVPLGRGGWKQSRTGRPDDHYEGGGGRETRSSRHRGISQSAECVSCDRNVPASRCRNHAGHDTPPTRPPIQALAPCSAFREAGSKRGWSFRRIDDPFDPMLISLCDAKTDEVARKIGEEAKNCEDFFGLPSTFFEEESENSIPRTLVKKCAYPLTHQSFSCRRR